MRIKINPVVALILTIFSGQLCAQPAETGPVARVFTCNFHDGRDMSDLQWQSEHFMGQLAKIGSEDMSSMTAFVWWPVAVSESEYDFIWFDYYANLNLLGRAYDDYVASEDSAAAEAAWEAVADCSGSTLHFQQQLYNGDDFAIDPPAVVEAFRCTFYPDKGMNDVNDVVADWVGMDG